MDGFWLLLIGGGIAWYFWNRSSQRESPPTWAVAPPVQPVADESPIKTDEWRYFRKVAEAALAQAKGGAVSYIEKKRMEHGTYLLVVRRWNSHQLIRWQQEGPKKRSGRAVRTFCPNGVSANLSTQQVEFWNGQAEVGNYRAAVNRTRESGAWNSELRGMIKAIEATLKNPVS
jgi:hypothetical protein